MPRPGRMAWKPWTTECAPLRDVLVLMRESNLSIRTNHEAQEVHAVVGRETELTLDLNLEEWGKCAQEMSTLYVDVAVGYGGHDPVLLSRHNARLAQSEEVLKALLQGRVAGASDVA
ncbi:hypothetical protein PG996_009218 [Apiospora saccharicola]|uniref:Uncharacterized protein n=1 Tax=Apiospora saccharicola TaxID=335842 RepID=A0ABR1UK55_9PEZI